MNKEFFVGQKVRVIKEPPLRTKHRLCAIGMEGIINSRKADNQGDLLPVRFPSGLEIWLAPEHLEPINV